MRVLVISATFPPVRSGGAPYAFRLCEQLGRRGLEVHVLTSRIPDVNTSPHFDVSATMRGWSWRDLPRLIRVARSVRPDVVNLHFSGAVYQDHPMITLAPGVLRRLLPRIRIVTHIEYPEPIHPARWGRGVRAVGRAVAWWQGPRNVDYGYGSILHQSDRIVVFSEDHVAALARRVPGAAPKCVLIPPPPAVRIRPPMEQTERERERAELGILPGEFAVAYYGLIYPGKGLETLIEAFRLLVDEGSPAKLLVVGGANEVLLRRGNRADYPEELVEQARRGGVAERIVWTGDCPVDSDRGSHHLRIADACALPFDDGAKLHRSSFAVAAAHGLPIVSTKGELTESAFADGTNVLLCAPGDAAALQGRLAALMGDADLRARLRDGALRFADEFFSWDRAVDRTIELFRGDPVPDARRMRVVRPGPYV